MPDVRALLLSVAVCSLLPPGPCRAGVPGTGVVVDALSDEFESPWSFSYQANLSANGLWYGQFRGAPEIMELITPPDGTTPESATALRMRSIDVSDDAYPGEEDLVTNFYDTTSLGRLLDFAEEPSFVSYVYFPPVSQWPLTATGQHTFGFRVAAWDHTLVSGTNALGEYYPSIWAYRDSDGLPYLLARVGDGYVYDVIIAQITTPGWFTLGLSWNAQGRIEYYAAEGRRALGTADLIYTDNVSDRKMEHVPYHFYSLRFIANGNASPDFLADRCRVFTRRLPNLPALHSVVFTANKFQMNVDGTTGGFVYRVQRSSTLAANSWQEMTRFQSNGQSQPFTDPSPGAKMYYRVARGAETLPPSQSALAAKLRSPSASPSPSTLPSRPTLTRKLKALNNPLPVYGSNPAAPKPVAGKPPTWD